MSDLKRISLVAVLVASVLALPSCGGGDDKADSSPAAGTGPAAEAEQPQNQGKSAAPDPAAADAQNGDGGTSAADAERAAEDAPEKKEAPPAPDTSNAGEPKKRPAKKPRTSADYLANLTPAERRKLNRDLYKQGKQICSALGPKEVAKSYKLPTTDPEEVARLYARAYEGAAPSLALPYQQGCLAGFRRFERNAQRN